MSAMPDGGSVTPEQLAARTGLPLRIVLRRLPLLELADLVHRRDGGVTLANGDGQVDAALADVISAYCAAHPDQPLEPYEIARGITRPAVTLAPPLFSTAACCWRPPAAWSRSPKP